MASRKETKGRARPEAPRPEAPKGKASTLSGPGREVTLTKAEIQGRRYGEVARTRGQAYGQPLPAGALDVLHQRIMGAPGPEARQKILDSLYDNIDAIRGPKMSRYGAKRPDGLPFKTQYPDHERYVGRIRDEVTDRRDALVKRLESLDLGSSFPHELATLVSQLSLGPQLGMSDIQSSQLATLLTQFSSIQRDKVVADTLYHRDTREEDRSNNRGGMEKGFVDAFIRTATLQETQMHHLVEESNRSIELVVRMNEYELRAQELQLRKQEFQLRRAMIFVEALTKLIHVPA